MPAAIRPNRTEVSRAFPVLGFTVRTGVSPAWFEVVLTDDASLLFAPDAKARRTPSNFYSSRLAGPLPAERGEAVYIVPPDVLARFAGKSRIYYAIAAYRQPDFRNPEVARFQPSAAPYVTVSTSYTGAERSLLAGSGRRVQGGYASQPPGTQEWGGDMVPAGEIVPVPQNGSQNASQGRSPQANQPGSGSNGIAAKATPAQMGAAFSYNDGYDSSLWAQMQQAEDEDAAYGIEGPIPDAPETSVQQAYSRALDNPDSSQATRFVAAANTNYRVSSTPRAINRIVIHITDGGRSIAGPISWFQNPNAHVSAHYIVGQDGEVVQMVREADVAWHARRANGDSIGIEHVANTRGLAPTEAQYCSSAALVSDICARFNIPLDREHIVGHSEADRGTSHSGCPNAVWNWDYYMQLVTTQSCFPMDSVQAQAMAAPRWDSAEREVPHRSGNGSYHRQVNGHEHRGSNGNGHAAYSNGGSRTDAYKNGQSRYGRSLALAGVPADAVSRMRAEFVANATTGSQRDCITIANAGIRMLYNGALRRPDGSTVALGSTIQGTMTNLVQAGLAGAPQVFEFSDSNGRQTLGVARPTTLATSVEQWLLEQAAAEASSGWYVFGLSLMDGYHSVVLALQFNGSGDPLTRLFWADQIYSGWDDVTGSADARITQLTQRWWDPLPAQRKARTRVTVWPLIVPANSAMGQALGQTPRNGSWLARGMSDDLLTLDDIEGDEAEDSFSGITSLTFGRVRALTADSCTDSFCTVRPAASASSEHFTMDEFNCHDGTVVPERFRGSVQMVMENLEVLRAELNAPISIVSGYRTCAYNSSLEGTARQSRHLCGQAADIQVRGYTPDQVHETIERLITAQRMQEGGLGLYNTFVHYDVRGERVRWGRRRGATAQQLNVVGEIDPDYSQATTAGDAIRMFADWTARRLRFSTGVPDTSFFPHSAICKIYSYGADGSAAQGSGFYIGPNTILTAAHVVAYEDFQATGFEIIPGLNGSDQPFGGSSVAASSAVVHPNYNPRAYGPTWDIAVIHGAPSAPNGLYFTLEELRMTPDTGIVVCGYAAVGVDPTRQHMDVDTIRQVQNGTFTYSAQIRQGSSGCPIFYAPDDQTMRAVGICVTNYSDTENRGLRLTDLMITWALGQ